jgi:formylglycine-generating enzyme required for sulfatase activity
MPKLVVLAVVLLLCAGVAHGQVVIDTVTVGNPGNEGELSGDSACGANCYGPDRVCGAVGYVYEIGKFAITAGQYTEFLNAVADEDTYGLYSTSMWDPGTDACQIYRSGLSGSYEYSVAGDWADRPVNAVSWGDAARFCNWLHNGQPTGAQDLTTTEDGSYYLNGVTSNAGLRAVVRRARATWVIPSEDEWYKAAYHYNDGVTGNYYDFPTSSDSPPGYVTDGGNHSGDGTPFVEGGTDPGNYATWDGDAGTDGIGPTHYRTEVGEWENSGSPYGTFDQGGNVWEWNEAVIDTYRGARGGAYYSVDYLGDMLAGIRYYADPINGYIGIGFRIARVHAPIPTVSEWGLVVMLLLVLGAGTVVLARRRAVPVH